MKKVLSIIAALAFILVGVLFLVSKPFDTSEEPQALEELAFEDLEEGKVYFAEDLVILDCFATKDSVMYMAVLFEDVNGEYVVMNMPVNSSDGIWEDVNDYMDDPSLGYGDLEISGYVLTEKDVNVEGKLYDYFEELLTVAEGELDVTVRSNYLRFDYQCDEDGDPYATLAGANIVTKVMGGVSIALGVLFLVLAILRKPKAPVIHNVPTYAPAQSAYAPQQPSYAPQQPVYQQPQEPVYPQEPAPAGNPAMEQLSRYQALVTAGVMTPEEYEQKRREILGL